VISLGMAYLRTPREECLVLVYQSCLDSVLCLLYCLSYSSVRLKRAEFDVQTCPDENI
jgi:hypothetical protein